MTDPSDYRPPIFETNESLDDGQIQNSAKMIILDFSVLNQPIFSFSVNSDDKNE